MSVPIWICNERCLSCNVANSTRYVKVCFMLSKGTEIVGLNKRPLAISSVDNGRVLASIGGMPLYDVV